jgi:spore coat protein H
VSATRVLLAIVSALVLVTANPAAQSQSDLFNGQVLHRIDLELHSADWAKLKAEFQENTYYPADMTWNGQTIYNAGIRSRGRGSRSATKPGLRVDFNEYSAGQSFLGLKSIILDNLTQDASGIHETVSMAFFNRAGVPASREAHARLYVRGEYIGVYAIVESIDKDFLARVFGAIGDDTQNDGHLYEFKYQDHWGLSYLGNGLDPYKVRFEPVTHESENDEQLYRRVETLIRLINETGEDRLKDVVGPLLDLPAFVRYMAVQNFLAETDGFLGAFGMNNFYLYRLENSEQHTFIAWDADNTFWGPNFPTNEGHADNILMAKLMRVPEYSALYATELRRAAELAEQDGWLNAEIARQVQLIDTAMRDDPSKPFSNSSFEGAAGAMTGFAGARIAFVRCELERGVRNCG